MGNDLFLAGLKFVPAFDSVSRIILRTRVATPAD
jgi:hypothetical protein